MLNKSSFLPAIFACLLVPASTLAGDVRLVSDTWDLVCRVEVTWGPGAPDGTPVEVHVDVAKGWSVTKPDRLCYSRPSTANNCDSGMTQWKTRWKCAEKDGTGTEDLSLK